jgi:hypothetical protein
MGYFLPEIPSSVWAVAITTERQEAELVDPFSSLPVAYWKGSRSAMAAAEGWEYGCALRPVRLFKLLSLQKECTHVSVAPCFPHQAL